ncbi:cyclic nucleotide-binding-like protein [Chytriomyces sp. MP71]|nr:cyclic nucleotide-binding-like protein [Chytriomyces sp. MP71]
MEEPRPRDARKLVAYYETKYRGRYFEEETLLADMNESLREDIAYQNTVTLLQKVPFFQRDLKDGRDEAFLRRIAAALQARYYIPRDFLFQQGDPGNELFFMLSGKTTAFVNGVERGAFYEGDFFGEIAFLKSTKRAATVQAAFPTMVYRLGKKEFVRIMAEFPEMDDLIEQAKAGTLLTKIANAQGEKSSFAK